MSGGCFPGEPYPAAAANDNAPFDSAAGKIHIGRAQSIRQDEVTLDDRAGQVCPGCFHNCAALNHTVRRAGRITLHKVIEQLCEFRAGDGPGRIHVALCIPGQVAARGHCRNRLLRPARDRRSIAKRYIPTVLKHKCAVKHGADLFAGNRRVRVQPAIRSADDAHRYGLPQIGVEPVAGGYIRIC